MLIECVLRRDAPIIVPIGNETYTFEPDEHGRRVAEVWQEPHIEAFLAVSHLYRKAQDLPEPGTASAMTANTDAGLPAPVQQPAPQPTVKHKHKHRR